LITDKEGNSYTNELIAILLNQENPIRAVEPTQTVDATKRSFAPGSEWLYYKIYCNPKIAEDILIENIYPLIKSFVGGQVQFNPSDITPNNASLYVPIPLEKEEDGLNQLVQKWFFIRYADPDNHIRVRLKLTDTQHLSFIQTQLNELFDPLLENRVIERIQLDTYNRELERYGFDNIDDAESLFYVDSENILDLISQLDTDEQSDLIKLKYACLNAYHLVQNFELEKEKLNLLISSSQQNYFNEHGAQKELKFTLDDKYRKYRKAIETLLTYTEFEVLNEEDRFIVNTISKKEHSQKHIIQSILQKQKFNTLKVNIFDFIRSLIHMHVNRLFKGKQRTYELLVYDFLQRSLKSIDARKQKSISQNNKDSLIQAINL
jgi:lantibiotic biosynthesis protein